MKYRLVLGTVIALAGLIVLWPRLETPVRAPAAGDTTKAYDEPVAPAREPQPEPTVLKPGHAPAVRSHGPRMVDLRGRVTTDLDEPAAGIWVSAYRADVGSAYALTDHAGQFFFGGLPEGHFRVSARASGYNEAVLNKVPRGASDIELVLLPLSEVRGRVVAAESGSPIRRFDLIILYALPVGQQRWQEIARTDNDAWEPIMDPDGRFDRRVSSGTKLAVGARSAGLAPDFVEIDALEPGASPSPTRTAFRSLGAPMMRARSGSLACRQGKPKFSSNCLLATSRRPLRSGFSNGCYWRMAPRPRSNFAFPL